ncbi:ATP-dependent endonuclease, partial [Morganella morganii]
DYHQANRKTDTEKTLKPWPVLVDHYNPYLFLNRSKPETHLAAFSRMTNCDVSLCSPAELRALIEYVKHELVLSGEDE